MSNIREHQDQQKKRHLSIDDKLSAATKDLARYTGFASEFDNLKDRHKKISDKYTLIACIYTYRFFISCITNMLLFLFLMLTFIESMPSVEIILLILFNFSVVATLFLSSAMAFYLLNKADKLHDTADKLCHDVKAFVSSS